MMMADADITLYFTLMMPPRHDLFIFAIRYDIITLSSP